MRNILASLVLAASFACAASANAATYRFETTSTLGTFFSANTPTTDDTSASFSVDLSFTSIDDVQFSNGSFNDNNIDAFGFPERAFDLAASSVDLSTHQINLFNGDNAVLFLTLNAFAPVITGSYRFGGPAGEIAEGSFSGTISGLSAVPLPASAAMFGAAVLALGAFGYGRRRKSAAATV